MKDHTTPLSLFLYFFRIGWFTFGGGWSIVAQMQQDFAGDQQDISEEELLDIISVGRSLPGTMVGNVAYLFGYHQCGLIGGICAVLGIILPPLAIFCVLTVGYNHVQDFPYIARALVGVRAVVAPIILTAVLKLYKSAFPKKVCYLFCVIACVLSLCFRVSCIVLVVLGAAAGLLVEHFGSKGEGESA